MSALLSRRSTPGLATGLAVGLAMLLMLALNVVPMANNDLWILLKVGELITDTGKIPETLLFPFTAVRDNHFNAHEWLVSVIYHLFERFGGLGSLMWIMGAFALVQFGLCVALARRQSGSLGVALVAAMLAMACANYRYVMRPELFALLFMVLLLMVLDACRTSGRWTTLLWTIPVAILWANCHGSFLLAPCIVGLFALGEGWTAARRAGPGWPVRARAGLRAGAPYAVAVVAVTAACAINPAGWSLLAFPFQLQKSEVVRFLIKEWLPTLSPAFVGERPFWIFVGVAAATLAVVVRLWRHLRATDVLLLAFFTVLAFDRSRHIVWFGFVALTVCARLIGHVRIEPARERQIRAGAGVLALAGICACMLGGNAINGRFDHAPSHNFSDGMIHELADPTIAGNVLNSYELGGELIYRAWPRLKPSIDSRVDSYGDDYLLFSIQLVQDEKLLNQFLEGNRVNYMLLLWRDFQNNVHNMPSIQKGWHIRLTNGDMFLLERNVPLPARAGQAASAAAPTASAAN